MPNWLRRGLLLGLLLIFVLMPFHPFLSTWGGTAIGPLELWKSWKELLFVVLVVPVIVWLAMQPTILRSLRKNPLILTITAYVVLTLLLAVLSWSQNGTDATLAGLAMNLRYLAAGSLAYLLFRYGRSSPQWIVRAGSYVLVVGIFVAILGILQGLVLPNDALKSFGYEKGVTIAPFSTIDDNPDYIRSFATLRGPNDFGAFLILPFLLVVAHFRRFPRWVSLTMLSFLTWALIASASRSAWLGLLVALLAYAAIVYRHKLSLKTVSLAVASVAIVVLGLIYGATQNTTLQRFVFKSSPGDPSLVEGSTENHLSAKIDGVGRVFGELQGCGPGCSGPASYYGPEPRISENYVLQIAEETGIIGVGLFIAIIVLVVRRLFAANRMQILSRVLIAVLAGYAVIGMLLHVWTDDPLSVIWWVLVGAVIGYNESEAWIKSKRSSRSRTSYSS